MYVNEFHWDNKELFEIVLNNNYQISDASHGSCNLQAIITDQWGTWLV